MRHAALLLAFVLAGSASGLLSVAAPKSESSPESSPDSADKFTFSSADAKLRPDENAEDKAEEDALVIFETILKGEKEIPKNEGIIVTSDDDDDDDDGGADDNDDDEDEIDEEVSTDPPKSLASDLQIRRQGDALPGFSKKLGDSSPQQRQDAYNINQYPSPYDTDNSPLLHLTQGGYQRPYSRRGRYDNSRQRAGSSPQQSETADRPVEVQQGQPQVVPQVTYTSGYQPQMDSGAVPMFYHPFESSNPFMNANGAPSGFFNAQQSPYPDFTSSNMQSPFAPRANGYSEVSREPNPFSQYQAPSMVNPNLMFHAPPQFVQAPMTDGLQRPVQNLFQTPNFNPFAGMNNAADSSRPDYSAYFRSPSSMGPPQFQGNPNFYNNLPNGAAFTNPPTNMQPDQPGSSRFLRYPGSQIPPSNAEVQQGQKQQQHNSETVSSDKKTQDSDQISVLPDKEDPVSVPFGTRIQSDLPGPQFVGPRDVYIRYPMKEAGYATEENLPVQNETAKTNNAAPFPFLPYPGFSNPDPYRNALNRLQQRESGGKTEDGNGTKAREEIAPYNREALPQFRRFPEAGPFYAPPGIPAPFALPERYPFPAPQQVSEEGTPACAKDTNATLCFKDPEYPRRELLYALNSDSFLLDRLVLSDQQRLDGIPLVGEENASGAAESQDNYICKSDLEYGTPLRAKNVQGKWKVVVNIEGAIGGGKFIQPVRTEVCRASGDPCSLSTDIRTRCVQKYSLQRLLSWSAEKGVHNDVFRLPVACSCQLLH